MHLKRWSLKLNIVKTCFWEFKKTFNIELLQANEFFVNSKVNKLFGSIIEYRKSQTQASPIRRMDNIHRQYLHCSRHFVVVSLPGKKIALIRSIILNFPAFHYILLASPGDDRGSLVLGESTCRLGLGHRHLGGLFHWGSCDGFSLNFSSLDSGIVQFCFTNGSLSLKIR